MRRFLLCASALIAVTCVGLIAQKVTTPEEYTTLMKANAQANGAMNKAIGSGSYADARMQVATLRTNYMSCDQIRLPLALSSANSSLRELVV